MFTLNTRDPGLSLKAPVVTHPRTPFTSRNAWHFAVASAYPVTTTSIRVLTEARITDGAVVAEWDAATNTGWMRAIVVPQAVPATDGHAGYLGEGAKTPGFTAIRAWRIPDFKEQAKNGLTRAAAVEARDTAATRADAARGGDTAEAMAYEDIVARYTNYISWLDGDGAAWVAKNVKPQRKG